MWFKELGSLDKIPHCSLSTLLKLRISHSCFHELPSDSRAFLSTPRTIQTPTVTPGKYCHFGLQKHLTCTLQKLRDFPFDSINLQFSIDGVPLSKSSSQQFLPILCSIREYPCICPLEVGIYFGSEKPRSASDYFKDLVCDIVEETVLKYIMLYLQLTLIASYVTHLLARLC